MNFVLILFMNEDRTEYLVFGPYSSYEEAEAGYTKKRQTYTKLAGFNIVKLFPAKDNR